MATPSTGSAASATAPATPSDAVMAGAAAIVDELAKAKALLDANAVTAEEHQRIRERILGISGAPGKADGSMGNVLVAHFEEDRRRAEQPWRVEATRQQEAFKSIVQQSMDELRTEFVDQAKNGLLSVEDVVTLTYLLHGTTDDLRFHAGCLLRYGTYEQRIRAHNFYVASALPDAFMTTWGTKLITFPYPLFPRDSSFSSINLRLLREIDDAVGGGDAGRSIFRRSNHGPDPAQAVGGEYWTQLQSYEDGTTWVDLTAIEDAHAQLMGEFAKVTATSDKMSKLLTKLPEKVARRTRARARGGDFPAPAAPTAPAAAAPPVYAATKKPPVATVNPSASAPPAACPPGKKLVTMPSGQQVFV